MNSEAEEGLAAERIEGRSIKLMIDGANYLCSATITMNVISVYVITRPAFLLYLRSLKGSGKNTPNNSGYLFYLNIEVYYQNI